MRFFTFITAALAAATVASTLRVDVQRRGSVVARAEQVTSLEARAGAPSPDPFAVLQQLFDAAENIIAFLPGGPVKLALESLASDVGPVFKQIIAAVANDLNDSTAPIGSAFGAVNKIIPGAADAIQAAKNAIKVTNLEPSANRPSARAPAEDTKALAVRAGGLPDPTALLKQLTDGLKDLTDSTSVGFPVPFKTILDPVFEFLSAISDLATNGGLAAAAKSIPAAADAAKNAIQQVANNVLQGAVGAFPA
ncbi:hypothetical protein C8F01DRAFT_1084748 [Mycena amicta]|nr:hypothetical protein C8F01DRAFT_1084748 [Mycena amicta]